MRLFIVYVKANKRIIFIFYKIYLLLKDTSPRISDQKLSETHISASIQSLELFKEFTVTFFF